MNHDLFKGAISKTKGALWEVEGLPKGEYDSQAVQYDKLISNGLYNRIMWGNWPSNYAEFCRQGLKSNTDGVIADIGCGTLGFTYKAYAEHLQKEIYFCDLSGEMLNIGKKRMEKLGADPSNVTFLRSDALNMPFKDNILQTVLSFGILHIFDNPTQLVQECVRILQPQGQLFLTSLCTERKLSAKYLNLLHKKGHVAKPLGALAIRNIVEERGVKIKTFEVKGGMAYVSGIKK